MRRKANVRKGYFPNPKSYKKFPYSVFLTSGFDDKFVCACTGRTVASEIAATLNKHVHKDYKFVVRSF